MEEYLINVIIKDFMLNLIIFYTFFKSITCNETLKKKICLSIISSIFLTILHIILKKFISNIFIVLIQYFLQLLIIQNAINHKECIITISLLFSTAISYATLMISFILEYIIKVIFNVQNTTLDILLIYIINFVLVTLLFRIKRYKHGFAFLRKNNDFIDLTIINVSATIIFICSILAISNTDENTKKIFIALVILGIIMIIVIQKTIKYSYKQKLLEKTVKDYEKEIKEKDKIIKEKAEENFKFSKINHEFYNRQKSLQLAVNEFVSKNNLNSEASEELISNIENLTKEYSDKQKEAKSLNILPKTEILEIDNMFKYMQEEANKNNIEFNLQINGNIFYMINNIIPENLLTTLIGDHLRDAIIAINSSKNEFRSIMAILGIKEQYYELCIYDSGIEFEIDTLLKLGLEQVTTHKEEGGTGIGFITTFETLNKTKASLIIEEKGPMSEKDYTKSVIIRFDNKNEYKIKSYRAEEIKKEQKDNRIIIEN